MNPLFYISGGDPAILKISSSRSKAIYSYTSIVVVFFSIATFNFFHSNLILFYELSTTLVVSVLLTSTMLFFLYVNLLISEPFGLKKVRQGEVFFSRFLRFIILSIDFFILIKFLELKAYLVYNDIQPHSLGDLLEELIILNETNPFLWVISSFLFFFSISPFLLKFLLIKENDYLSLKRQNELQIIHDSHQTFLRLKNELHEKTYYKYKGKKSYKSFKKNDSIDIDPSEMTKISGHKEFLYNWKKKYPDGK